jgi:hypothetical protein
VQGLLVICNSIVELGGIFSHTPMLVRRVRKSDNPQPGVNYVVIEGNHRLYLFTHPYPTIYTYNNCIFDLIVVPFQLLLMIKIGHSS